MPFATVTWCDGRIDVRTRVPGRADRPRIAVAGKLTEYNAAGGRSSSAKPWTNAASSWLATAPGPAAATAAATFNRRTLRGSSPVSRLASAASAYMPRRTSSRAPRRTSARIFASVIPDVSSSAAVISPAKRAVPHESGNSTSLTQSACQPSLTLRLAQERLWIDCSHPVTQFGRYVVSQSVHSHFRLTAGSRTAVELSALAMVFLGSVPPGGRSRTGGRAIEDRRAIRRGEDRRAIWRAGDRGPASHLARRR